MGAERRELDNLSTHFAGRALPGLSRLRSETGAAPAGVPQWVRPARSAKLLEILVDGLPRRIEGCDGVLALLGPGVEVLGKLGAVLRGKGRLAVDQLPHLGGTKRLGGSFGLLDIRLRGLGHRGD